MSYKETSYVAHPVDENGCAKYTDEENKIWHELITRQIPIVTGRACDEYMQGLELLNLPRDRVPQCPEISRILQKATGWLLEPVPALIPFDQFFYLLANRRFPAATFIRSREEMKYLREPDIFHEVFGHCPLLTNQAYADFTENYGKLALHANKEDRALLARLYWFTIEFGLIRSPHGIRIYGGGILSSPSETVYALDSDLPQRKPLDPIDALRTPYRIDIMQPIYFIIEKFNDLYHLIEMDLLKLIKQSQALGEHKPSYTPKKS